MSLDEIMPEKQPDDKPQEVVAIDLGSNSFHLIIARIVNGSLQVLSRLKQRVHIADGLDANNVLSQEAIDRGLSCLAMFAERLQGYPPENVRIVATHTLRIAANSQQFLEQAAKVIPYPIEIISGQEEARLIYLGVAHTQPEKGRRLIIDIGGGSTELVIGEGFKTLLTESRPMGCVSFSQRFFADGEITKSRFLQAQLTAEQRLEKISWQYQQQGWQFAYGASGTIKSIHNVLKEMGKKDGAITAERLQLVIDRVLKFKNFKSIELAGVSEERRDVFVAGLAILAGLFKSLNIQELRLSLGALREGVLYEMEESLFRHHDIRSRTATSLAEHYNIDKQQAERVLHTTRQLYSQWKKKNKDLVNPQLEALLNWASMLHEVGLSINYSNIQRHSAYILQNSNLPGFNQEHQLILATLIRFHRKSIKLDEIPHFNLIKKKDLLPLIQLLRLAVLLNNQRQTTSAPESLEINNDGYHISLIFPEGYLEQNSLVQYDLEKEQQYWQEVTGWKLFINEPLPE
jgi:exopolyphosphatase/guanosine-5'-triphosphate,3'-diphosphate pyrophosphatase